MIDVIFGETHVCVLLHFEPGVARGRYLITTVDLSCVKIMSVKLHSEYIILLASLCVSFALFSQKLREWQRLSAYFLNTPRNMLKLATY